MVWICHDASLSESSSRTDILRDELNKINICYIYNHNIINKLYLFMDFNRVRICHCPFERPLRSE